MTGSSALPSGYALFCDDIREELGDKYSLIGVYTEVLRVAEIPFTLPQLAVLISYWEDPADIRDATFKVLFTPDGAPDEEILSHARGGFEPSPPVRSANEDPSGTSEIVDFHILLRIANIRVRRPGRFKVRAYRGDDEIRLGTLLVDTFAATKQ